MNTHLYYTHTDRAHADRQTADTCNTTPLPLPSSHWPAVFAFLGSATGRGGTHWSQTDRWVPLTWTAPEQHHPPTHTGRTQRQLYNIQRNEKHLPSHQQSASKHTYVSIKLLLRVWRVCTVCPSVSIHYEVQCCQGKLISRPQGQLSPNA